MMREFRACEFLDSVCEHFCAILAPLETVQDVQEAAMHFSLRSHILQEQGLPPLVVQPRHHLQSCFCAGTLKETAHLASAVTMVPLKGEL